MFGMLSQHNRLQGVERANLLNSVASDASAVAFRRRRLSEHSIEESPQH